MISIDQNNFVFFFVQFKDALFKFKQAEKDVEWLSKRLKEAQEAFVVADGDLKKVEHNLLNQVAATITTVTSMDAGGRVIIKAQS